MEFRIYNGQGIISIINDDGNSFFRLKKPIVGVFSKPSETTLNYLCLLPYDKTVRDEIHSRLHPVLSGSLPGKLRLLKKQLYPLYPLFPSGKYKLTNSEYYYYKHWDLVFVKKITYAADADKAIKAHTAHLKGYAHMSGVVSQTLMEHSTDLYPASREYGIFATQAEADMDMDRVAWYEEQIKNGERPFAILFQANTEKYDSARFIVDGHHKLMAYKRLGMLPQFVLFTQLLEPVADNIKDLVEVMKEVYPWQQLYVLGAVWEKEPFVSRYYANDCCKTGLLKGKTEKEYYENGQLIYDVTYKGGYVDGPARFWYENGQLKHEAVYKDGWIEGEAKWWYENGQLWEVAVLSRGSIRYGNKKWDEKGNPTYPKPL